MEGMKGAMNYKRGVITKLRYAAYFSIITFSLIKIKMIFMYNVKQILDNKCS
jgi:hypothetical protein